MKNHWNVLWSNLRRIERQKKLELLSSSDPHPDPFFWHSFSPTIWKSFFLAYTLTFFLAFYLASILIYLLAYIFASIWDIFWNSLLHCILSGISSEILCGWGPAGNTLIRSSRLNPGREEQFDPELAEEVRRGTLWSTGCCSGPAGNTACNLEIFPKAAKKNTLLRVIPTMTFIHFLTGKSSGILSGILSGISSGICSGISSGILSGK